MTRRSCAGLAVFGAAWVAFAASASAQTLVADDDRERATTEAPEKDELNWAASAGGVISTGNTESWQLTAGSTFRSVFGSHGIGAEAAFNYGQANLEDDMGVRDGFDETAKNFNGRLRYDYFLTPNDALFIAGVYRWDPFAGLDARVQVQAGYLRNLYAVENHRLWGEAGYDITYDNFDPDPLLDENDPTIILDGTAVVHAARLYLGYDNQLNEAVQFLAGLEALVNVEDAEDTRLNGDAALRSSVADNLKLEVKFRLQFDNVPVPGAENLDTTTTVSVIYTLI